MALRAWLMNVFARERSGRFRSRFRSDTLVDFAEGNFTPSRTDLLNENLF